MPVWNDKMVALEAARGQVCKFRFYMEFTILQCTPVLLYKPVSTSTSLSVCLGYDNYYSFCVIGVAVQMKSAKLKHLSPYPLYA